MLPRPGRRLRAIMKKTIPRFSIVYDKETETLLPRAVLTVVPQCLKQV